MEFIGELAEKFIEGKFGGSDQQAQQAQRGPEYAGPGPTGQDLPYPWIAQWDDREQRYIYLNEQTGERTWHRPGAGYGYEQAPPQPYGQGPPYGEAGYGQSYDYNQPKPDGYAQEPPREDHSLAYGAAGVLAGGVMAYEGEKVYDRFEEDKQNLENFPENAAEWTGEKVGEVERIPEDIEARFDRVENRIDTDYRDAVNGVEDFPENTAEWVGDKVGGVERFGDEIGDAYDAGYAEGRGGW